MKHKKCIALTLASFLLFSSNVKAVSCSSEEKAKLNTEVANVKVNYEIKERVLDPSEYSIPEGLIDSEYEETYEAKSDYFQINILNLTENMYIEVSNDYNKQNNIYSYSDTNNGNLSIEQLDILNMVTYTIKIYSSDNTGCSGNLLKTLYIKLPRYNEYSDYGKCTGLENYYLCQRYVTYDEVDFSTFNDKINKEREKKEKEEEKKNNKWYKNFVEENEFILIIGGVILVVIAGAATVIKVRSRRDEK